MIIDNDKKQELIRLLDISDCDSYAKDVIEALLENIEELNQLIINYEYELNKLRKVKWV